MAVFADYAKYYDLLYRDKDYAGEAAYIASLIRQFSPGAITLMELGSGTGKHAALLCDAGFSVHGVELSDEMLTQARRHATENRALTFSSGDIRTVNLDQKFDVAISLFHVISYQIETADIIKAFSTARKHLDPSGLFIFDCWYGPAVLTEAPSVRVKRVSDDAMEVTRLVEPELHPNLNRVDVNYQMFVRNKQTGVVEEIHETHRMRYLFQPEIEFLFEKCGFRLIHAEEWMTRKPIGSRSWGACFVAQAVPVGAGEI